jgi:hypothetical protein
VDRRQQRTQLPEHQRQHEHRSPQMQLETSQLHHQDIFQGYRFIRVAWGCQQLHPLGHLKLPARTPNCLRVRVEMPRLCTNQSQMGPWQDIVSASTPTHPARILQLQLQRSPAQNHVFPPRANKSPASTAARPTMPDSRPAAPRHKRHRRLPMSSSKRSGHSAER